MSACTTRKGIDSASIIHDTANVEDNPDQIDYYFILDYR